MTDEQIMQALDSLTRTADEILTVAGIYAAIQGSYTSLHCTELLDMHNRCIALTTELQMLKEMRTYVVEDAADCTADGR